MKLSHLCLVSILFASSLFAKDFDNGNFAEERKDWQGDGKIVYLKPDGTTSPTKSADTTPVMEISLSKTQPRELTQKFTTAEGTTALNVEVVYKGSADYKLNEKSTKFSKDITWGPGGPSYWTGFVTPKVDMFVRLDQPGGYIYYLAKVTPGGDWKTLRCKMDIGEKKDVKFCIVTAPGEGSLFIKSISVTK